MVSTASVNFAPSARLLLLAGLLALLPLAYVWLRARTDKTQSRLALLCAVTLFLTFDLIVFGAFTRLSDSGLGCPDWPGCYGSASPLGAQMHIDSAQAALPSGPVTTFKAWIEMIHRYLAMTVGALILAMTIVAWQRRASTGLSPWWPTCTLFWVIVQGLFGKYTVTLKLYPAVVTLHLLGGIILLALLVLQREALVPRSLVGSRRLRAGVGLCLVLLMVQISLGGWVSSNYAVLACSGFPQCNGAWWPEMDISNGYTLLRGLGEPSANGHLTLPALVAIQMVHRLFAVLVVAALAVLAWRLWRTRDPGLKNVRQLLAVLLLAQVLSGLTTVILGWPLVAALAHSAGAAALVFVLTAVWARMRPVPMPQAA